MGFHDVFHSSRSFVPILIHHVSIAKIHHRAHLFRFRISAYVHPAPVFGLYILHEQHFLVIQDLSWNFIRKKSVTSGSNFSFVGI